MDSSPVFHYIVHGWRWLIIDCVNINVITEGMEGESQQSKYLFDSTGANKQGERRLHPDLLCISQYCQCTFLQNIHIVNELN